VQIPFLYVDEILALSVLALSLNLLVGYVGIFSPGHAGIALIGAYSFTYLWSNSSLPFGVAVGVSVVVAGFGGAVLGGAPCLAPWIWSRCY
jgi:branched-chain amino acid transport system permease protein